MCVYLHIYCWQAKWAWMLNHLGQLHISHLSVKSKVTWTDIYNCPCNSSNSRMFNYLVTADDMSSRKLRVREVLVEREMLRSNLISNYFSRIIIFLSEKWVLCIMGRIRLLPSFIIHWEMGPSFPWKNNYRKGYFHSLMERGDLKRSSRWMHDNHRS